MTNLWLFDIDGVLVNLTRYPEKDPHLKAYQRDYRKVLGIEVPAGLIIETYGMSELEMHRHICSQHETAAQLRTQGIVYSDELSNRLTEAHLPHFMEELKDLETIEPLEGVVESLKYLQNRNEYKGVVTGNLKEPAEFILNKSSLINFFSILSCDDGNSTRTQIFQRAIDEARNRRYDFDRVIVIGDTTKDIEAGKYAGAFTVAVATGSDSIEKLQGKIKTLKYEGSSIVVPNLRNYQSIYQDIMKILK